MKFSAIETRVYRYPLDPPFVAAWDPVPRIHQDATIVVVTTDDGHEGYASGDAVPDRELLERLLIGLDPSETDTVHEMVETVDLHHGRNWIVEVAVWDLLARARGEPLWRMLGAESDRIGAYASSGELVERGRACAPLSGAERRRGRRDEDPPALTRLARRPAGHRGGARRGAGAGGHGRRESGLAHAG